MNSNKMLQAMCFLAARDEDIDELPYYVARSARRISGPLKDVWQAKNYEKALNLAAEIGDEDIVTLCKGRGATDFDVAMCTAAFAGHEHIVRLCAEWGATHFNGAMLSAARRGHVHTMHLCKEWGATDFDGAMIAAVEFGKESIVELRRVGCY